MKANLLPLTVLIALIPLRAFAQTGNQKAYAGIVETCPFKSAQDKSLAEILDSVKSSLTQLAKDCPQLSDRVKQAENRLQISFEAATKNSENSGGFTTNSKSPNPSLEGIEINCSNYSGLLQREREIAMSRIGIIALPSRYSNCAGENQQDCIEKIFMQTMIDSKKNCKSTAGIRAQEEMIQKLQKAAESYAELIRESNQCPTGARTSQLIMNTSSSFLDTIASISNGFGLTGIISGFLAKTIGGIIESRALEKSPKVAIRQLDNETNFENLACVWFQLQNRNLRCQEFQSAKSSGPIVNRPLCSDYLDSRQLPKNMINLKNLNVEIKKIAADTKDDESLDESLDNFRNLLTKEMPDPMEGAGKPVSVFNHLTEIATTLIKSNSLKDQSMGEKVQALLVMNDRINKLTTDPTSEPSANGPAKPSRQENLKKIKSDFKGQLEKFNLDAVLDRYWSLKGVSAGTMVLLEIEPQLAAMKALSHLGTEYDGNVSKINLATNLMVKYFKDDFTERLKLIRTRYDEALKTGDKSTLFANAVQLTNLCSLAAGMYHAKGDQDNALTTNSLRLVSKTAPVDYADSCKAISCLNQPKPILFASDKNEQKDIADEFRNYQCQVQIDYDVVMKNLKNNITKAGQVCK